MRTLKTEQLYLPQQPTPVAPPLQSFTFPKPLSYDFRVAEYVDKDGKILKVSLQMQVVEHDQYGTGNIVNDWHDVPRIKFNEDGLIWNA